MIDFIKQGRTLVVNIKGDIDHHTSNEIKNKIDREFNKINAKNMVFDFSQVTFMDSSGIGMLIGRYKVIEKQGGTIGFACISNEINRIFEISGLHKILKTYETVEEALKNQ